MAGAAGKGRPPMAIGPICSTAGVVRGGQARVVGCSWRTVTVAPGLTVRSAGEKAKFLIAIGVPDERDAPAPSRGRWLPLPHAASDAAVTKTTTMAPIGVQSWPPTARPGLEVACLVYEAGLGLG